MYAKRSPFPAILCGRSHSYRRNSIALAARSNFESIFALARAVERATSSQGTEFASLERQHISRLYFRVIKLSCGYATCTATRELNQTYGVSEYDEQLVLVATDAIFDAQVWWNQVRTQKPQTFTATPAAERDPTSSGGKCDFCSWRTLTAADAFGRIENASCVTASNLFKYAYPCHGLVLFKHHDPLAFTAEQVCDLLAAAGEWIMRANAAHPAAQSPFLLWNCLPRAGASQYHGHAQIMLTESPTPAARTLKAAVQRLDGLGGGLSEELRSAYSQAGLLRTFKDGDARADCFASLAPTKDMELTVLGAGLACPAFGTLLHGCMRTLIERLGVTAFNVSILNIEASGRQAHGPVVARVVSRGSESTRASDYGGLEVFGRASIGRTDPFTVVHALDKQLQDLRGLSADG